MSLPPGRSTATSLRLAALAALFTLSVCVISWPGFMSFDSMYALRQARTGILDAFFHHYAREAEGRKPFLDWVREDYDEAALRQNFRANGLASFVNDWVLVHE